MIERNVQGEQLAAAEENASNCFRMSLLKQRKSWNAFQSSFQLVQRTTKQQLQQIQTPITIITIQITDRKYISLNKIKPKEQSTFAQTFIQIQ